MYRGHCVTCLEQGPKTWPREEAGQVVVEEVQDRKPGVTASYTGESGFSFGVRGAQHLEALEKPGSHPDNAFLTHKVEYHQACRVRRTWSSRWRSSTTSTNLSKDRCVRGSIYTLTPQMWS